MIRRATERDGAFLQEMLAVAADWRPGAGIRSSGQIMAEPVLAHYVADWGAAGDVGFIAEEGRPVGAAWRRFFPGSDPGFGFVDETIPEVSIGVLAPYRGRGIGTLLLEALIAEARRCSLPALSLSVEPDNPAVDLYRGLGFVTVGHVDDSLTMLLGITA